MCVSKVCVILYVSIDNRVHSSEGSPLLHMCIRESGRERERERERECCRGGGKGMIQTVFTLISFQVHNIIILVMISICHTISVFTSFPVRV